MTHIIYSQLPLTDSFGLPLRINGMHRTQSDLMRIWTFYLLQFNHTGFDLLSRNAPINVELGGRHGMGWGLALRYRWGIWPILFSWGRGYLNLSSPDMGIFDHWLRRKKLILIRHFSFTHALYSLEVMKVIDEDESKGNLSEFDCFVFTFCFI